MKNTKKREEEVTNRGIGNYENRYFLSRFLTRSQTPVWECKDSHLCSQTGVTDAFLWLYFFYPFNPCKSVSKKTRKNEI